MFNRKSTRDMVMSASVKRNVPNEDVYPKIHPAKELIASGNDTEEVHVDIDPEVDADEAETPEHTIKVRKKPDSYENTVSTPAKGKKSKNKKEKKKPRSRSTRKSSSPILKSKAFWGIASIIVAAIIAFVLMPAIESSIVQRVSVVVAAQEIPEGTKIESNMLQTKEISKVDLPDNAVTSANDAVGKYAELKLMPGDTFTFQKVAEVYHEDSYLYNLPDGKMAMSIELSDQAQSVSGKLRSGDVVRVYAVYKKNGNNDSVNANDYSASLINELQYVEVLSVTNSSVQDIQAGNNSGSGKSGDEGDSKDKKSIATVTLLVNNKQAQVLSGLNNNATLYAALVVRGDEVKKKAALDTENKYLESEVTK